MLVVGELAMAVLALVDGRPEGEAIGGASGEGVAFAVTEPKSEVFVFAVVAEPEGVIPVFVVGTPKREAPLGVAVVVGNVEPKAGVLAGLVIDAVGSTGVAFVAGVPNNPPPVLCVCGDVPNNPPLVPCADEPDNPPLVFCVDVPNNPPPVFCVDAP